MVELFRCCGVVIYHEYDISIYLLSIPIILVKNADILEDYTDTDEPFQISIDTDTDTDMPCRIIPIPITNIPIWIPNIGSES